MDLVTPCRTKGREGREKVNQTFSGFEPSPLGWQASLTSITPKPLDVQSRHEGSIILISAFVRKSVFQTESCRSHGHIFFVVFTSDCLIKHNISISLSCASLNLKQTTHSESAAAAAAVAAVVVGDAAAVVVDSATIVADAIVVADPAAAADVVVVKATVVIAATVVFCCCCH